MDAAMIPTHEYANLFPMMDGESFAALVADIQENGLLEPIVLYDEKILDGRNRYRACNDLGIEPRYERVNGKTNPLKYVISKNLARRHLNETQRAVIAAKLANMGRGNFSKSANLQISVTQPAAAIMLNVSPRTVASVKTVEREAPELLEKMERGEMTAHEAEKKVKEMRRYEQRAEIAKLAEVVKPSEKWSVRQADIQKWQAPRQYDYIITDPPYVREYLYIYDVLAYRAAQWLKPGGLLIAMCGQSYLDEIYAMMSKHLQYYWTAAYLTPGQPTPLRQRNVNTTWKPLLIYSNSEYQGKIFGDVFKSDGNDKSMHKWGQSESGMYDIISKICLPGQYVLDPFCGAGTTGIASLKHGCLFDGIDIDERNVKISIGRLGSDSAAQG